MEKDEVTLLKSREILRVLTFNIHNGINRYGKYNLEQIADFVFQIKPDLAGLQEVSRFWSPKTKYQDMVGFLGKKLGMYPAFFGAVNRNNKSSFGNLLLSKWRPIKHWTETLPGELEKRSFIVVQVGVGGARVNFSTTHLGLSASERLVQVSKIVDIGLQLGAPLIITGDFNETSNGPGVEIIKRNWIKHKPFPPLGTVRLKNGKIGPEIDMVFTSSDLVLKNLKVYENELSDHLPVCGDFEIKTPWNQVAGGPVYVM